MLSKNGLRKSRKKKRMKKLDTQISRKKLKKKAEALLHQYLRKRACDFSGNVRCYSCRKTVPYEKTNAGHYRHGKLDLDERNLKVQCITCNLWKSGELGLYTIHLVEDYGLEWVKRLKEDADKDVGQYSYEFLLETIEKYNNLLKSL